MLNRFWLPGLLAIVLRLWNAIGYNNGKYTYFLCKRYKIAEAAWKTLPSLILAKARGGGYTEANLRENGTGEDPKRN